MSQERNETSLMALNQDETAEQEEPYEPTASDLALFANLRVTEVAGAILQARIDSEITLETYNKLYEVARKAQIVVETLRRKLEPSGYSHDDDVREELARQLRNERGTDDEHNQ